MKRLIVIIVLIACAGAVAFASLRATNTKKQTEVKKVEKKDVKKKERMQTDLPIFCQLI